MASPVNTATGASLAVTLNTEIGTITTESLATAAGSDVVYVLTNAEIASATSVVVAQVVGGTNTTQPVYVRSCVVSAGSVTVNIRNGHASAALNGTLVFDFIVKN